MANTKLTPEEIAQLSRLRGTIEIANNVLQKELQNIFAAILKKYKLDIMLEYTINEDGELVEVKPETDEKKK